MRRVLLIAAVLALIAPGNALARECGIPDSNPLWVDFAGHDAPLPQKPGLTLAFTSGTVKPAEARQNGAATVFFDLNFNNRVGTTDGARRSGADPGARETGSTTSPSR